MSKLDFYKSKRVLVTGHTGFKGTWLSLWLKEFGADVIGYSLEPPTSPSLFEALRLQDKIKHVIGDIRDEDKFFSVFQDFQPEFVFHLAAQSLVRLSYRDPSLTYETNVMGTINMFEAIRKTDSVRVVVNVTSDKCYQNQEWQYGYRENDPIGGYDPYSSSKGCAEIITSAYRCSFFNMEEFCKHKVAISTVRAGNVIGGGDWGEDRLVPDCIKALSKDKCILIRNPNAVRPWQYVLEPVSGYLWLGVLMSEDGAKYSGAWNFGPNYSDMLSVEDLVKLIIKIWGRGKYSTDVSNQPHESTLLKLDCSKANTILKWKAAYNVNETMEETVKWYKDYYNPTGNTEMYDMSYNQIVKYNECASKNGIEWSID